MARREGGPSGERPVGRVALCSIAQQFGRGTVPAFNHWERVRCDDVLACTWLKKEETSSKVRFVATGGCSRCLSMSWREEARGSLVVRPRPLGKSS